MSKKIKILVVSIVLILFSIPLFAYDGTLYGGYDGTFSRFAWTQEAGSLDLAEDIISNYLRDKENIDKLFSIGEEDADDEDIQVITDLEVYLQDNFHISNGDGFSYVIKRGDLNRGWDGWLVLSHFSGLQGWLHYMYYFSIN